MTDDIHPLVGRFHELHYARYGSGRPVVALHGYGQTSYSWRHLVAEPPEGLALYLFDLRGCGNSAKPCDEKYSLHDQAGEICRFIIESDLTNVTLIGHSLGGGIALLAALELLKKPDKRLLSLVLIDSLSYPQRLPLFIGVTRNPILGPFVLSCFPPRLLIKFVLWQAFYNRGKIDDNAVRIYAMNLASAGGRYALHKTAQQLIPPDLDQIIASYSEINVPTLIVWGTEDRIISPVNGAALHSAIPNSTLVTVEHCGHIPHEEKEQAAIPAILAFLRA